MISMLWKSAILLAHHGSCTLMDRFCGDDQGIDAVLISPNGAVFEFSNQLEEECTNN